MRIVFDTNVLVAAFISHGTCAELLEYCIQHHTLLTSKYILKEFCDYLVTKFKFPRRDANEASHLLFTRMTIVTPSDIIVNICRDPKDEPILGTAIAGNCQCIVTGDKDLLILREYRNIDIIRPNNFWRYEDKIDTHR